MKKTFPIDKKTLRAHCLAARKGLEPDFVRAATGEMTGHLLAKIGNCNDIIAVYNAVQAEISLSGAALQLAGRGATLCLPVIEVAYRPLLFRHWLPGQALENGLHHIDIPPQSEPWLVPDVVIVPLVAFDGRGHRLGYGAGYYDRTIAGLRELKKSLQVIGVAYSMQQVEQIPCEAHDARLDAVVTEQGTMVF